jgi:F-type H+-transporting ATPase subunit gamma
MASTKDLKKRIGTVKNTQQTTRAMKMVSAAKLRRAQDAILAQRPYAKRINTLIGNLSAAIEGEIDSPLLGRELDPGQKAKLLLVLVTSDRGLCGPFNGAVIKAAQRWVMQHGAEYESIEFSFVGRRGHDFYKGRKTAKVGPYFAEAGGKVTFAKAKKLSQALVDRYLSGEVDEVKFIYNEFKNAVTQEVQVLDLLPVKPVETAAAAQSSMIIVKPSPLEVLQYLLEKNFAIQTFRILLESQAGEHGARMSAMENATKNAGEMIKKLSLQYNKQRQAGITKELLEIISGSESQKG